LTRGRKKEQRLVALAIDVKQAQKQWRMGVIVQQQQQKQTLNTPNLSHTFVFG
jgi:hypothetical protein